MYDVQDEAPRKGYSYTDCQAHMIRPVIMRLTAGLLLLCSCVCVLVIYFGDNPSDQEGETCASFCVLLRGLHFAAYFPVCPSEPTGGHTGERGEHWGLLFFLLFAFLYN